MPTYQYACTDCGHAFDEFQKFSDDALTVCPDCQGRLRKVFNAVGVVFKGSGFYRNDSRKTSPGVTAGASSESSSSSTSSESSSGSTSSEPAGSSSSSDSKPAATPAKAPKPAPATSGSKSEA